MPGGRDSEATDVPEGAAPAPTTMVKSKPTTTPSLPTNRLYPPSERRFNEAVRNKPPTPYAQ
jgi:hypothetical protein